MNRQEFNRAFTIAQGPQSLPEGPFNGFGLPDFQPVHVTLRQVAELMRWQALQFNGEWNAEALQEIAKHGRQKFIIIGNDSEDMLALKAALNPVGYADKSAVLQRKARA